jgi:hypothetical protein
VVLPIGEDVGTANRAQAAGRSLGHGRALVGMRGGVAKLVLLGTDVTAGGRHAIPTRLGQRLEPVGAAPDRARGQMRSRHP